MSNTSNIIPFPGRFRRGLNEVEILEGTLTAVIARLEGLEDIDEDTTQSLIITFNTVIAWLEERSGEES